MHPDCSIRSICVSKWVVLLIKRVGIWIKCVDMFTKMGCYIWIKNVIMLTKWVVLSINLSILWILICKWLQFIPFYLPFLALTKPVDGIGHTDQQKGGSQHNFIKDIVGEHQLSLRLSLRGGYDVDFRIFIGLFT